MEAQLALEAQAASTFMAKMNRIEDTQYLLTLDKAQLLSIYPFLFKAIEYKLMVGAVIFDAAEKDHPKILLLKRYSHEECYPNVFALPGGKVEDTDATILDTIKREVHEETTLSVHSVVGQVREMFYSTNKLGKIDRGHRVVERFIDTQCLQLNFVCKVDEGSFRVNPEGHSEGLWATKDEALALEMTDKMKLVIEFAFKWQEDNAKKTSEV